MFIKKFTLNFLLLISFCTTTFANDRADEIKLKLNEAFPQLANIEIEETPVDGVFRFWSGNDLTHIYYSDGHLVIGDMLDLERKKSLGDEAKQDRIAKVLEENSDKTIVYGQEQPKAVLNVFTSIDCPYCRRLHREIPKLVSAGIQVRYFAYPFRGLNSQGARDYVSVWCSSDRKKAMDYAKANGRAPEHKECENTVLESYKLGREIGVKGTPYIILGDGSIFPNNVPRNADSILKFLGLSTEQ